MSKADSPNQAQSSSWSPSPSPPSSPDVLELTEAERFELLTNHHPKLMRPSSLGGPGATGKTPLVVLSPEELQERVEKDRVEWEAEESSERDYDMPLWEELANAVLWTIPFGFLYAGL
jgi:hypothetical protein